MKKLFFLLFICAGISYSGKISAYTYEGQGTESSPYLIYTAQDLDSVRLHLRDASVHFKMMNDIDLTDYLSAKTNGWAPIGGYASSNPPTFDGVFDGNGHTISGLWIASTSSDIGFFSWISQQTALIENLTVETDDTKGVATDMSAKAYAGILVGTNGNTTFHGGTIKNCSVSGIVSGWRNIGGLVGQTSGSIENCHANNIKVIGTDYNIGGLIGVCSGYGDMTIKNCSVNSASIESGGNYLGGLIGTVTNASHGFTSVQNCSTSDVTINNTNNTKYGIGGLLGVLNGVMNSISNCSVTNANLSNCSLIGGLAGKADGTTKHCYAKSVKISSGTKHIGGFVGEMTGVCSMDSCYCEGSLVTTGGLNVGGFVGYNNSTGSINHCNSDFKVVSPDNNVGGFVGLNNTSTGSIANSSFHGTVKGKGNVGGFAGMNKLSIINCFSVADLIATTDSIGGFIGVNNATKNSGVASNCFFSGKVEGVNVVGGFIGKHNASTDNLAISQCYSHANILSAGVKTGGFIGFSATGAGNMNGTYCTGKIIASSTEALGGFIGDNAGAVAFTKTYFDPAALGLNYPIGGSSTDFQGIISVGAENVKKQAGYGLDFAQDWSILDGSSYPYLKIQTAPLISMNITPTQLIGSLQNGIDSVLIYKDMNPVAFNHTVSGNVLTCTFESGLMKEGDTLMVQVSEQGKMFSYPVAAIVSNSTDLNKANIEKMVSVYFFDGVLNIKGKEPISKVEIFGLSGSLVFSGRYDVNDVKIALDKYSQGMYLVKAVIGGQSVVHKIVR